MSDEERGKLLAKHEEDMAKLEAAQGEEQQRTQDALQVTGENISNNEDYELSGFTVERR